MVSVTSLLILLIAAFTVAAPVFERLDDLDIFPRADNIKKSVHCPSKSPWTHIYTWDAYLESMHALIANMNKKCKEGGAKLEDIHLYKPFRKADQGGFKCYPAKYLTNVATLSSEVNDELNKISHCYLGQPGKTYLEFPLMKPIYTGGSPGPDRVIMIVQGSEGNYRNAQPCLAISHRNKDRLDPNFVPCKTVPDKVAPPAQKA